MNKILRCRITVYGDAPIFDVELPVGVTLNNIERAPDNNGFRTTDSATQFEGAIPIPKIDPGKDGFVFYIYHFEKEVATLRFDKPPTYAKPGDATRSEALLKQDPGLTFGNHMLWPAYDNLEQQLPPIEKPKSPEPPLAPTSSPTQGKQGKRSRRKSGAKGVER
jgi:hypothetical protein